MRRLLNKLIEKRFLHYLIAGASAFFVEYGCFYVLYTIFNIHLIIANSVSFLLGLLTSFFLNRLWTFSNNSYTKKATHQLVFYVVLAVINLLLTNVLLEALARFGVDPRFGKILAMIITSLWNFFLFRAVVFSHQKKKA